MLWRKGTGVCGNQKLGLGKFRVSRRLIGRFSKFRAAAKLIKQSDYQ